LGYLGWGLARLSVRAVLASITGHGQVVHARGNEGEWVALSSLLGVEVVARASRGWAVNSRLEGSLGSTAVEWTGRVRVGGWAAEVGVEGWIWASGSTESGWEGIGAWWTTEWLAVTSVGEATSGASEGAWAWSAGHGAWTHAVTSTWCLTTGWVTTVCNNHGTSTASAAAKTADVLGEVVITATLRATLPITSTERNNTASTHAATTVATVVTHVLLWWHHGWRPIAVTTSVTTHIASWASTHSWERAAEARSAALEVGETARWAGPVSWAWAILAWWEWSQNLRSTVKDTARGWGDLDGLLVESTAVHAQALSSLLVG
jgi:hypothetical protein